MEFQFPKLGDELKSIPINIKLIDKKYMKLAANFLFFINPIRCTFLSTPLT